MAREFDKELDKLIQQKTFPRISKQSSYAPPAWRVFTIRPTPERVPKRKSRIVFCGNFLAPQCDICPTTSWTLAHFAWFSTLRFRQGGTKVLGRQSGCSFETVSHEEPPKKRRNNELKESVGMRPQTRMLCVF
eukprot:5126444-Amphidinium_carterae.2